MDAFTYIALMLAGLFILLLVLMMLLLRSGQSRTTRARNQRDELTATTLPRVQVVALADDRPLVWVVGGRAYEGMIGVEDATHRAALESFVTRLDAALPHARAALHNSVSHATPALFGEEPAATVTDTFARPESPVSATRLPISQTTGTRPLAPSSLQGANTSRGERAFRTYEEEMELPLMQRLRSSFFGSANPAPQSSQLMNLATSGPILKVDEVDSILQAELAQLTNPPRASIRSGPTGLIEIVVDGRVFERIDDVPDPTVRQLMKDAVHRWEAGLDRGGAS